MNFRSNIVISPVWWYHFECNVFEIRAKHMQSMFRELNFKAKSNILKCKWTDAFTGRVHPTKSFLHVNINISWMYRNRKAYETFSYTIWFWSLFVQKILGECRFLLFGYCARAQYLRTRTQKVCNNDRCCHRRKVDWLAKTSETILSAVCSSVIVDAIKIDAKQK